MKTNIKLDIRQRAEALRGALRNLHTYGIAIAIDHRTVDLDKDVQFLQFQRAACAMLGIPDNCGNLALNDVYDLAKLIQARAVERRA